MRNLNLSLSLSHTQANKLNFAFPAVSVLEHIHHTLTWIASPHSTFKQVCDQWLLYFLLTSSHCLRAINPEIWPTGSRQEHYFTSQTFMKAMFNLFCFFHALQDNYANKQHPRHLIKNNKSQKTYQRHVHKNTYIRPLPSSSCQTAFFKWTPLNISMRLCLCAKLVL